MAQDDEMEEFLTRAVKAPQYRRERILSALRLLIVIFLLLIIPIADFLFDWISSEQRVITLSALLQAKGRFVLVWSCFILALTSAALFLQNFYQLDCFLDALSYLLASLFGLRYRYLLVREGQVDEKYQNTPLAKVGGPGFLVVYTDSAVVLERNGRFTRVLGPGYFWLERFETVREAVDLRPQKRQQEVHALTRDGIPIKVDLEIEFLVRRSNLLSGLPAMPYFFEEKAVQQAVYNKAVDKKRVYRWSDLVKYAASAQLRDILGREVLDKLSNPEGADERTPLPLAQSPRRVIQNQLSRAIHPILYRLGAMLQCITLGTIEVEEEVREVIEQRIKSWQAEWARRAQIIRAEGEAEALRLKEFARAQAQMEMILAVTQGLKKAAEAGVHISRQLIVLRSIEALEKIALDPWMRYFVPHEVIRTLNVLRETVKGASTSNAK